MRTAQSIAAIIKGNPAASLERLPQVWNDIEAGTAAPMLSAQARADYVEAARLFRHHDTPMVMEALSAIGHDFDLEAYPNFEACKQKAQTPFARRVVEAVEGLFAEFGYEVPASFYRVILAAHNEILLFKGEREMLQDRLWDSVVHGMLLVTPIGLRVQSVLSQYGVRFEHVMECGCHDITSVERFDIALDPALKSAYLQNMVAASFEQYGVNARTSKAGRGF